MFIIHPSWMPSNKGYEELIKIIRRFLWTKWDGGKGFISTSWSHCIQPKHRGGLGLIDPKTQGFCLVVKWIIRVAKGDEPWKVLVRNRIILPQLEANGKVWGGWTSYIMLLSFLLRPHLLSNQFGKLGKGLAIF